MACAAMNMISRGALAVVDFIVRGSVEGAPVAAPPSSPVIGTFYRVATGASGAFAGHEGELAGWTAGGWRFVAPVEGVHLTERGSGVELAYLGGAWTSGSVRASKVVIGGIKVLGARGSAIAEPSGGAVVDAQARLAVGQILAALRTHGLVAT